MLSIVTGLPEGRFYYRVRQISGDGAAGSWSDTLTLKVKYPDRRTVAILLSLGLIVFIGTSVAVIAGHRRTQTGGRGK